MTTGRVPAPIDPGLLARFREAGRRIAWRPAPGAAPGRTARIAHLNDEEARVETWGRGRRTGIAADSGPVGALAIVLEVDRRGAPEALGAHEAGRAPAFPAGAIVATWGGAPVPTDARPTLADLVELARYALA